MAEQQIVGKDGSVTIISDSYAPFGEKTVGPPLRAEDPSTWRTPSLDDTETCRRYGKDTTVDDLLSWQAQVGFPKPSRTVSKTRFGSWTVEVIRYWDVPKLVAWEAHIASMMARIPKR